jgi:2,3-dihydroxybenzoate decarboxylase
MYWRGATSCSSDDVPLITALAALGEDRVLFSVDYPYEDSATAGRFLDKAAIDDKVRDKVANGNARKLMKLNKSGS